MIWYKAILTNNEIERGVGDELENDFRELFHQLNDPHKMAIYKSGYIGDQHIFFYVSVPKNLNYELGVKFKKYKMTTVIDPFGYTFRLISKNLNRIEIV